MRFTDFFDKIFIINLPERTDRRRHIEQELVRISMPLNSEKISIFPAIRPADKAPFHSIGCKGCFMSHLTILKLAKEQQLHKVLILEDDANFLPGFLEEESNIVSQLQNSSWDIVQFGYFASSSDPKSAHLVERRNGQKSHLLEFDGEIRGTPCVAISGKNIDKLIDFLETLLKRPLNHPSGGPMPVDGAYNVFSQQTDASRLILTPPVIGQISSRSDISPKWHDQYPMLRPILSGMRKLGLTKIFRN